VTGGLISTVEPVSLLLLFNTTRTLSGPYGHGTAGTGVARGPRIAIWTEAWPTQPALTQAVIGEGEGRGYPSPYVVM
jgi:hypothetical protein